MDQVPALGRVESGARSALRRAGDRDGLGSAERPGRVYYHHLRRCGGGSLSAWLDQQTADDRCWSRSWISGGYEAALEGRQPAPDIFELAGVVRRRGVAAFYWSDIVHDHQAIGGYAPPGTLRFTVLRDPVDRLLSQVGEWRRLDDSGLAEFDPALRACQADARRLPLASFLERHGRGRLRHLLDNHMVRSIAMTRLGPAALLIEDAGDLAIGARLSLDQDYDLVGVTERADRTRRALCRRLGWAPEPHLPPDDTTGYAAGMYQEALQAADILTEFTRHDRELHARARARLDAEDASYGTAAFEADAAVERLAALRGRWCDGRTVYSVRGPLIGHGWHGRDGAGTAECAVWTGPARDTTLYMPVPAGVGVTVYLWVRGYAVAEQREALRLRIDGRPVGHRHGWQNGYADVVAADATTTRGFLRLEIELGDPLPSGTPGQDDHDPRLRGLAFDQYGWAVR